MRLRGLSSPKVRHCHDRAWSPPRADDLGRPRPLHDDPIALSISAPHRVAARLVVGPDDVLNVGVGNERYDAVPPSGNGGLLPYSGATIWPALRGAQGEIQGGGAGALADEGRRLLRALHIYVFEN